MYCVGTNPQVDNPWGAVEIELDKLPSRLPLSNSKTAPPVESFLPICRWLKRRSISSLASCQPAMHAASMAITTAFGHEDAGL
ncbi:hypothetical protein WJX73_008522 [Symbiochloris irregularis]|uniref:Uncharacterized protein n=1 Tax=Symbiochloris irregularis TaxID=706552 RepID=A0AAW1NXR0_9CHLO